MNSFNSGFATSFDFDSPSALMANYDAHHSNPNHLEYSEDYISMFESAEDNDKLIPAMIFEHGRPSPVKQVPVEERNKSADQSPKKRSRTAYTSYQLVALERAFLKNNYISRPARTYMAKELGLFEKQIKIWFQNRRMKDKTGKPAKPQSVASLKDKKSAAASREKHLNMDKEYDHCIVTRLLSQRQQNFLQSLDNPVPYYAPPQNKIAEVKPPVNHQIELPSTIPKVDISSKLPNTPTDYAYAAAANSTYPTTTTGYYYVDTGFKDNCYEFDANPGYGYTSNTSPSSDLSVGNYSDTMAHDNVYCPMEKKPHTTILWGAPPQANWHQNPPSYDMSYPVVAADAHCIMNL